MNFRRHPSALSVFAALALGTACGPAGSGPGGLGPWEAVVDTVGDTIIVRTTSGSVWGDTIDLIPEVAIGVVDGADEYLFGRVVSIAVTGNHDLYVADGQVPALRKYDANGTYVKDLGREGGGPGEYASPDGGLVILSDGRIILRDPGNSRFTVFSASDEFLDTWRHPAGGGFNTSRPLYLSRGDTMYTMLIANMGVPVTEWEWSLTRISPDGATGDTLLAPTWNYERPQVSAQNEGSSSSTSVPFSPDIHWTWSPEGYFVGSLATAYRVELFRTKAPVVRIERDYVRVPVLPGEGSERERRITKNFREQFEGWRWNGPAVPDFKPPITDVMAGQDGRIWVQISQPGYAAMTAAEAAGEEEQTGRVPLRYREPVAFDVYDVAGRFLGHVRTPAGFATTPTPVFRDDKVWAVVRDELDVTTVVRFRMDLNQP